MSAGDERLREWALSCKARLTPALNSMRSGRQIATEERNGVLVDIMPERIRLFEDLIKEMDEILERTGGVDVGN